MRCEICGREYSEDKIVEWLGHRICVYCMGYGKERTKRGPPTPPKPKPMPEEEKPGGIPPEYRRPPEIFKEREEIEKEEKEAWEVEEEAREAGPPEAGPPEAPAPTPREEKTLLERIVDAIRSGVATAVEAIREAVRRVREWFQ